MEAADGHSTDPVQADDTAGMGGTDRKLLLDVLALAEMSGRPGGDDVGQLDDHAVVFNLLYLEYVPDEDEDPLDDELVVLEPLVPVLLQQGAQSLR